MCPFCPFCGFILSIKKLPKPLKSTPPSFISIYSCNKCSYSNKSISYYIEFLFISSQENLKINSSLRSIKHSITFLKSNPISNYINQSITSANIINLFNPDSTSISISNSLSFKPPLIKLPSIIPFSPSNILDKLYTYIAFS